MYEYIYICTYILVYIQCFFSAPNSAAQKACEKDEKEVKKKKKAQQTHATKNNLCKLRLSYQVLYTIYNIYISHVYIHMYISVGKLIIVVGAHNINNT